MRRVLFRLVALLVGLAALGSGLYVQVVAAGLTRGVVVQLLGQRLDLVRETAGSPAFLIGAAVLEGVGLVFLLLSLAGREPEPRRIFLRMQEPGLTVTVSERTLQRLLLHEARRVEGVRALRAAVRRGDDGWDLECNVGVVRGTSFSAASTALSRLFRESLEWATGEPVHAVTLHLEFLRDRTARGLS